MRRIIIPCRRWLITGMESCATIVGSSNVMPFRNPLKHYDHANRNEGNLLQMSTKITTTLPQHSSSKQSPFNHSHFITNECSPGPTTPSRTQKLQCNFINSGSWVSVEWVFVFCILYQHRWCFLGWGFGLIRLLEETMIQNKCVEEF